MLEMCLWWTFQMCVERRKTWFNIKIKQDFFLDLCSLQFLFIFSLCSSLHPVVKHNVVWYHTIPQFLIWIPRCWIKKVILIFHSWFWREVGTWFLFQLNNRSVYLCVATSQKQAICVPVSECQFIRLHLFAISFGLLYLFGTTSDVYLCEYSYFFSLSGEI